MLKYTPDDGADTRHRHTKRYERVSHHKHASGKRQYEGWNTKQKRDEEEEEEKTNSKYDQMLLYDE